MKKVLKTFLLVFLCVITFIVSLVVGVILSGNYLTNRRYKYLKVNFTEDVGFVIKDLKYGEKELNNYDLYLPADDGKENYALILFVHGGGFSGGDKGLIEAKRHGEYLASKGYVVASVNYTYYTEESKATILDMYEELMDSVDDIVKKTDELGYHLNEMATTGGSAGGCLAMMVAFKEPDRLPLPVRFVFEETGPASFEPELWNMQTNEEKAYFVNSVSGKGFTAEDVGTEEFQEAIDEISVATMINENSVPILLAYGPNDKIVSVKSKYPLLEKLDEYNIPHDYVEFPNSGHGLLGDPDKTTKYYQLMDRYLEKYLNNN